jgi:DNA-binding transcriptional ArsR family regulator
MNTVVDRSAFIYYRRSSMKAPVKTPISRDDAETWAGWFRALGDPTRVMILHLLAIAGRPMTVGEIVDAIEVGQSTVSHHLKILGDVRFALVERTGTSSLWRINDRCLDCFPTVAEVVMGRLPSKAAWDEPRPPRRRASR